MTRRFVETCLSVPGCFHLGWIVVVHQREPVLVSQRVLLALIVVEACIFGTIVRDRFLTECNTPLGRSMGRYCNNG